MNHGPRPDALPSGRRHRSGYCLRKNIELPRGRGTFSYARGGRGNGVLFGLPVEKPATQSWRERGVQQPGKWRPCEIDEAPETGHEHTA